MSDVDPAVQAEKEKAMSLGFVTGAVVQLKSGGPKMSVSSVGTRMYGSKIEVWCQWFHNNEPKTEIFPYQSLNIVEKASTEG